MQNNLPFCILILGSAGTLGHAFMREVFARGWRAIGLDRTAMTPLTVRHASELLAQHGAYAVVNAAGFNLVDAAESSDGWQKAVEGNVELPRVWALAAKERGIPFVHVSSDYVFSGEVGEGEHSEDDNHFAPVNAYGKSKLMGEEAVKQAGGRWYIARTSRLFGVQGNSPSSKKSFADIAISLALHKPTVSLVNDEYGCSSFADDVAWGIAELLTDAHHSGVYHLVNQGGAISWEGFAREIYAHLGLTPTITSVSGASFAAKRIARVPANLDLAVTRGPVLPARTDAIARCYRGARPVALGAPGLVVLQTKSFADERGSFREVTTQQALESYGLIPRGQPFIQVNESVSKKDVLRGLHFQVPPFAQAKLVECVQGSIRDVIVDIRQGSPTFGKVFHVDLEESDGKLLWVPIGFAHGFVSKKEGTKVRYTVWGAPYTKAAEGGLNPLDPSSNIPWEVSTPIVHPRDAAWPELSAQESPFLFS